MKNILFLIAATLIGLSSANAYNENIVHSASRWDEEAWKDIPGQNFARFYIFNVTNAHKYDMTQMPEKPIVKEVGPYVYLVKREKFNISQVFEDGSFYYRERKTYEFQPQLSEGRTEDDTVHVINTALITFMTRGVLTNHYGFGISLSKEIMEDDGEELILKNQKVSDVLFNGRNASVYVKYEGLIRNMIGDDVPPPGYKAFEDGRYGIFKGISGKHQGLLRAQPRAAGSKVGEIISWDDNRQSNAWAGGNCNKILGTDGSLFSPELSEINDLDVFLPEISRSAPLSLKETTEYGGILGSRYTFSDEFLEEIEMHPENECFCIDIHARCLRRGALDLQTTKMGAPYVLTYPHFIKSDGTYAHKVDGLVPAPSNHESFYDIEPKTGTVLQSSKKFQYNIRVGPIYSYNNNITYFRTISEYVFPLLWVDESFQLDGDIVAALKSELDGETPEETTKVQVPVTTTTTATQAPSTTTTTEKSPEKNECSSVVNDNWISGRFKELNLHLYFLTCLIIISLSISGFCILLLINNARATKSMMRSMNSSAGTGTTRPINAIYSHEPEVNEKEKI